MVFDLDNGALVRLSQALRCPRRVRPFRKGKASMPVPLMAINLGGRFSLSLTANGRPVTFLSGAQRRSVAAHILVGYAAEELGCEGNAAAFADLWQKFVRILEVSREYNPVFDKSDAEPVDKPAVPWGDDTQQATPTSSTNGLPGAIKATRLGSYPNAETSGAFDINDFLSEEFQKISRSNQELGDFLDRWKSLWGEMNSSFLVILDHEVECLGREIVEAEMSNFLLPDTKAENHFVHFCDKSNVEAGSDDIPAVESLLKDSDAPPADARKAWVKVLDFFKGANLDKWEFKLSIPELYSPHGSVYLEHVFPPGVVVADIVVRNGSGEVVRRPKIELFRSGNSIHLFSQNLAPQSYYAHFTMQPEISGLHVPALIVSCLLAVVLGVALLLGKPDDGDVAGAIATSIVLFPGFSVALISVQERSGFDRVFLRKIKAHAVFLSLAAVLSAILIARASEAGRDLFPIYVIVFLCFLYALGMALYFAFVIARVFLWRKEFLTDSGNDYGDAHLEKRNRRVNLQSVGVLVVEVLIATFICLWLYWVKEGWLGGANFIPAIRAIVGW